VTIKQSLSFVIIILLLVIAPSGFCMERASIDFEISNKRSKASRPQRKESTSQSKRQKTQGEEEFSENNLEALPFDILPFELWYMIFFYMLQSIIKNNTVFAPLDGVKEFLDKLSLINKECNIIALDFGWNYVVSTNDAEPKYRIMVQDVWRAREPVLFELKADDLNTCLKCCLSENCAREMNLPKKCSMNDADGFSDGTLSHLNILESLMQKSLREKIEYSALLIIAGANVNLLIEGGKSLLQFVIENTQFHDLISLLILKKVNVENRDQVGNTALMYAVHFPPLLQMLLKYDSSGIDQANLFGASALSVAIRARKIESVRLLLEHGGAIFAISKSVAGEYLVATISKNLEMKIN